MDDEVEEKEDPHAKTDLRVMDDEPQHMMDIFNIIQFPVFKKIEKEHTAIKSIYDEDEDAEELKQLCPTGVYDIEDLGKKGSK